MQADLHRYLFDQGIDFRDQGREHHSARGRVDFLVRETLPVAVELKVWRDRDSSAVLANWLHQASTYPTDFGIRDVYLIILCTSSERRLRIADDLGTPAVVETGGLQIHVRLCDAGRLAPSRDASREPTLLTRTLLGLD